MRTQYTLIITSCFLKAFFFYYIWLLECIYYLTSVGVRIMISTLELSTKLALYQPDTVYPALLHYPNMNMFLYVINPISKCLDHHIANHFEICDMRKKKPSMSNPQLAEWAKETFGLQKASDASTISKILKRKDQGL
ncbi:hypothetical protein PHYBLDRAFT_72926 [Phycomyces blakesleeanus NRRL 1555(-)]|uniref:Homeodomain-like DNA binding domain-containing transcription factor n=1 Tax=Phycomyces blakesleeanus (strain ATCC 8743b / DSM 1359 / FGSC 10004 / NBRC 33097 / NRRL 1555) TaxID=763407 RepID=A0A162YJH0_PHYB8|nr:hypothetical protein PHYBLDRAFT_72926 [Phycomyces blakesleeanus NRRL 1555(-)]OAD81105.1 hypothetical protein PHYBLDRAFT_72926 [Phycomyces blakesleeanus NRRL 1555(-)]|eukprot:XP_018299145.1 hypothetical protein PHYBLDRAFT_72926 [Phycomyces blakesleeanus NRRL 1555(-)]